MLCQGVARPTSGKSSPTESVRRVGEFSEEEERSSERNFLKNHLAEIHFLSEQSRAGIWFSYVNHGRRIAVSVTRGFNFPFGQQRSGDDRDRHFDRWRQISSLSELSRSQLIRLGFTVFGLFFCVWFRRGGCDLL